MGNSGKDALLLSEPLNRWLLYFHKSYTKNFLRNDRLRNDHFNLFCVICVPFPVVFVKLRVSSTKRSMRFTDSENNLDVIDVNILFTVTVNVLIVSVCMYVCTKCWHYFSCSSYVHNLFSLFFSVTKTATNIHDSSLFVLVCVLLEKF